MRKNTSARLRDAKARNKLLLATHQPQVLADKHLDTAQKMGQSSVALSSFPVPLCAHDVMLKLERKKLESARTRGQGFADKSEDTNPESYCSDHCFADNLAGIRGSSLLSSLDSLVQNIFNGMSRTAVTTSNSISELVKAAVLSEAGCMTSNVDPRGNPKDVRTHYEIFGLNPRLTTYACCPLPTCSAIYPPNNGVNFETGYPLRCIQTKFGVACKEPLMDGFQCLNGKSVPKPIKPFQYHHFHDHVASMLARPGIEEAIQSHMENGILQEELTDIMSSAALRNFLDDTGLPFIRVEGTELRLVWSLSADWYNPRSNKASGKVVSSGAIAMVCLSLPPDLRNLEENVYLAGVIPGPHEPAVDATNHFITPLVNDLVVSYKRGVHYSQTHLHPAGRTSRSAVVPVIADTMASKKITGNCGHGGKYFCSRCRLPRDAIDNLNPETWPRPLTRMEHEASANLWRGASSKSAQNTCLKKHGLRWSPLLLLPYWQPSAWTITEAVHVILLGLIPRHCRDLLGLNFADLPSDEWDDDPPTTREIDEANRFLRDCPNRLSSLKMNVLKFLCRDQGVILPPLTRGRRKKKEYISALLGSQATETPEPNEGFGLEELFGTLSLETGSSDYSNTVLPCPPNPIPLSNPITKQSLAQIREDIRSTLRPDWQAHLPMNFGSPEHGKLKADQWRTSLEFDIPVSLIRIKSMRKPSGNIADDERLQKLIDHTMDLALAIAWGLSRRSSPRHAERYTFYMKRYLNGIKVLFPDYDLKPNHHYALHIPDILLAFGPLHGTWAFSMERLIGRLQKMNTNSKIGEMETTALSMFCRRAKLINLMASPKCPVVLKEAWNRIAGSLNLRELDEGTARKFLPSVHQHQRQPSKLDDDIHAAFASFLGSSESGQIGFNTATTFKLPNYKADHDITYSGFDKSLPHSLIYFRKSSDPAPSVTGCQLFPGQIRLIFQHYRPMGNRLTSAVFVALHEFQPAHQRNPFSAYPEFRAALYLKEPLPSVTIIQISQIHCHANYRPWDASTVVMRAIDRSY